MGMRLMGVSRAIGDLERIPGIAVEGMTRGLVRCQLLLKREAIKLTPWRTGTLAGNFQTPPPEREGSRVRAIVENTTSYAAVVHEAPPGTKFRKKGTGPKYLERPLFELIPRFRDIISKEAGRSFGK